MCTVRVMLMSDLKAAQEMIAAAVAAKQNSDPELVSVVRLLKSLDRASKNVRTFGQRNVVAQKFFEQFYTELTTHLIDFGTLSFGVQREGLFFKEEVVYSSQTGATSENFGFKLYSDGIKEITFHQGIEEEDVLFFFDALWDTVGIAGTEDDDIVTRLWTKNLPTLTIVTADEVMKVSEVDDVLTPQENEPQDRSLQEIIADCKARDAKDAPDPQQRTSRLSSGVTGYEVSELELAALAKEIAMESSRDSILYSLDIMLALFSSERSPAMLDKIIDVYDVILKSLIQGGHWSSTEHVLMLLSDAEAIRPELTDEQKQKIHEIFEQLGSADIVNTIEGYLNRTEKPRTDGLTTILLMMKSTAVPALCGLLGNLEQSAHQLLVVNALQELARDSPDHIARHLTDRRPGFVRNILSIITAWNNPKLGDNIEKLLRYPDPQIRREAVKTLAVLKPSGNAAKLIPLLNDAEEGVRLTTLKSLLTGNYVAPFSIWDSIINADTFGDRPSAEKRNIFHAIRLTSKDEAVPYWRALLTEWGWTNRKKREELALMAVDALGKLGTAAAHAALEFGANRGTTAIKHACALTLAVAHKPPRTV